MIFYFSQHVLHPIVPHGVKGEVSESMRKNPRIDMASATQGKPSLQNDMVECNSGLVIGMHEHDDPTLNLPDGHLLAREEVFHLFLKK